MSVLVLLTGGACIVLGFRTRLTILRHYGLTLVLLSVLKLAVVDVASQNSIIRVISLAAAGVVCFVLSLLYNRFAQEQRRESNQAPMGPGASESGEDRRRAVRLSRTEESAAAGLQHRGQELTGVGRLGGRDLLRGSGHDDGSPALAALWAHVDDPVGVGDDVEVVLDDDHGVALVDQSLEHRQQLADVFEMQTGGRLVEDVDGPPGGAALELGGELDALGLTTGERGGRLPSRTYPSPTSTRVLR